MPEIETKTLQRGTPTPDNYVPIEHYIKMFGAWYKQVTDKEELKLLGGNDKTEMELLKGE